VHSWARAWEEGEGGGRADACADTDADGKMSGSGSGSGSGTGSGSLFPSSHEVLALAAHGAGPPADLRNQGRVYGSESRPVRGPADDDDGKGGGEGGLAAPREDVPQENENGHRGVNGWRASLAAMAERLAAGKGASHDGASGGSKKSIRGPVPELEPAGAVSQENATSGQGKDMSGVRQDGR